MSVVSWQVQGIEMPGVLTGCCQRKNSRACANERIPRRHALATSHWQRYVSDQNTVAKYRPCSSTFCGNCSFCTLPNVFACQNSLKHFASHFYTLAGNSLPPHQCTQEIPIRFSDLWRERSFWSVHKETLQKKNMLCKKQNSQNLQKKIALTMRGFRREV